MSEYEEDKGNPILRGLSTINTTSIIMVGFMAILSLFIMDELKPLYLLLVVGGVILIMGLSKTYSSSEELTFAEVRELILRDFREIDKLAARDKLDFPEGKFYITEGCDLVHDVVDFKSVVEWNVAGRIIGDQRLPHNYIIRVDPKKIEFGGRGIIGITKLKGGEEYIGEEAKLKPIFISKKDDFLVHDEIEFRQGNKN